MYYVVYHVLRCTTNHDYYQAYTAVRADCRYSLCLVCILRVRACVHACMRAYVDACELFTMLRNNTPREALAITPTMTFQEVLYILMVVFYQVCRVVQTAEQLSAGMYTLCQREVLCQTSETNQTKQNKMACRQYCSYILHTTYI